MMAWLITSQNMVEVRSGPALFTLPAVRQSQCDGFHSHTTAGFDGPNRLVDAPPSRVHELLECTNFSSARTFECTNFSSARTSQEVCKMFARCLQFDIDQFFWSLQR